MELFINILSMISIAALLIIGAIKLDTKIASMDFSRWGKTLCRSLLYAVIFTPTAYHHAPNTIVAPFHLSTIAGNIFSFGLTIFYVSLIFKSIICDKRDFLG